MSWYRLTAPWDWRAARGRADAKAKGIKFGHKPIPPILTPAPAGTSPPAHRGSHLMKPFSRFLKFAIPQR
jgi:hypothetical protein